MKNDSHVLRRTDTPSDPFPGFPAELGFMQRYTWPASWVAPENNNNDSFVTAYRLELTCDKPEKFSIYVTADQRYWLYLDGRRIGSGSERGSMRKWFYEEYELELSEGKHSLGTITWYLKDKAPWAQVTSQPGFLLAAQEPFTEKLSTGLAPWQSRALPNVTTLDPGLQINSTIGCGARILHEGLAFSDVFKDNIGSWSGVKNILPGNNGFYQGTSPSVWVLSPGRLPSMLYRKWIGATISLAAPLKDNKQPLKLVDSIPALIDNWQDLLDKGKPGVVVPANTAQRILIDLGDYCCSYYSLKVSSGTGAEITVSAAERLSTNPDTPVAPPERHTIDGMFHVGIFDRYRINCQGPHCCEPLWWQAGRWIQIDVKTTCEPLVINSLEFHETRYPLQDNSKFESDDDILNAIVPVCYRTLQNCAHETYMDCPYWEQLQYLGDTRIQALLTYITNLDPRLPEKALDCFKYSISGSAPFIASNFPSRSIQIIPPFSLWWICMLYDYALWRGNPQFVGELLPMCWWIMDHFLLQRCDDGLVKSPKGWNYVDSVGFPHGEPPGSIPGQVSGLINLQVILALNAVGDMSTWTGEVERAAYADRLAAEMAASCEKAFWDPKQQLLADDLEHISFSEHTQSLALLSGRFHSTVNKSAQDVLGKDSDLIQAGPYFSHYICLALHKIGAGDRLCQRLASWKRFLDAGFHTFPEHDIQGRSDCHAWSAHPLFHFLHSILGVRPGQMGFRSVVIEPCLGPLKNVSGKIPHPEGDISVKIDVTDRACLAEVTLPEGLPGIFRWGMESRELHAGTQRLEFTMN